MNELIEDAATVAFLGNTAGQWLGAVFVTAAAFVVPVLVKKLAFRCLARNTDPARRPVLARMVSQIRCRERALAQPVRAARRTPGGARLAV